MRIEEWLSILESRFRLDIVMLGEGFTTEQGQRLIREIKEGIILELAHQPLSEREMLTRALKMFLAELLGRDFRLPAGALGAAAEPRHVGGGPRGDGANNPEGGGPRQDGPNDSEGGINDYEAVCLWLGVFRDQTPGLAGLWQLYLDLEDSTIELPPIIHQVFAPQCEEYENQTCIAEMIDEAQKEEVALSDRDTSKIIAWAVGTSLPPRSRQNWHHSVADLVQDLSKSARISKAVNSVNQDLKRGGNTLMDELVRHVYREIDN